ncbi:NAD(P)-dependent oxidoreductase [Psychrosphaera ytuae]|uniref:NAD(P)-dependent oxidoreductase n=1 Tax=Psychrosphaera ytuae TaxID=2820710 RepID=A0A975HKL3_9GAMM|nr:NAD(P)-dependent oxidoreductase [Psychrosphaera ytuae]QTH64439.1 NAD(P)-dependent oxidoreductase [Psychrosphaera ytuae]
MKVSFIGLGVMGYPMAGHLQKSGFDVTVFNRTTSKAQAWQAEYGGTYATTPGLAAEGAQLIFICVGNDDDVRAVLNGSDGVFNSAQSGAIIIDNTTTSAELAREMAEQAKGHKLSFLDAPVSGGQAGAENGVLTVMVGGEQADFDFAKPAIDSFSKFSKLMGPVGSGQLTKMVNQICIAGVVQGLAEGLHFARSAGLDGVEVVEAISKGAAGSWQMDNRHQTMWKGEYDFGFAIDWMRKDLGFALDEAKRNGSHLPVTALVDQFYSEVQAMQGNRWDTSSLLARLERYRAN